MPGIFNNEREVIQAFSKFTAIQHPNHRYSSFDYCFGYFQSIHPKQEISSGENLQRSCLHLAAYLASWGMYRGSSFLLREKSISFFKPLLEWVASCEGVYWTIDLNNYDQNYNNLLKIYEQIERLLGREDKINTILITKIMLGIFGNTPAFDKNFRKTFSEYCENRIGFYSFKKSALEEVYQFYKRYEKLIENMMEMSFVFNFNGDHIPNMKYTRAKIVDMIGFGYQLK